MGQCTAGLFGSGACGRNYCMNHDGRQLVQTSEYRGKVCLECAPKVQKTRTCVIVLSFVTVLIIALIVIALVIRYAPNNVGN